MHAALHFEIADCIAACTVDAATARIGDGPDAFEHGRISHANAHAAHLGVKAGMPCKEAAAHLHRAHPSAQPVPALGEHTDAILRELGFDGDVIAGLRAAKAI